MSDSLQSQKNITEFLAVATEFCAFLAKADSFSRNQFVDKSIKLLSLLYLKASMLESVGTDHDGFLERYVSEEDYNTIHSKVSNVMGDFESYFDITEATGYETGETVNVSTSECFADIFQDVMNFVEQYREFGDEEQRDAAAECYHSFTEFWGIRVLMLAAELHLIRYSSSFTTEK